MLARTHYGLSKEAHLTIGPHYCFSPFNRLNLPPRQLLALFSQLKPQNFPTTPNNTNLLLQGFCRSSLLLKYLGFLNSEVSFLLPPVKFFLLPSSYGMCSPLFSCALVEITMTTDASKLLAQLIVAGSGILVRAFGQAYKQALSNAAKSGAAQEAVQNIRRGSQVMAEREARQILGITEKSTWEEVLQKYDNLFRNNAKGSFYLQSKVQRAKECLEQVYKPEGPTGI
ncbi:hypothetical protein Tsubulata_017431 [Turnera subulata]|uniref:Uncharacterized protein n=1 Tax=Turnera subulata TaxID=218843 RepID=A0A9Q0FY12_9ROSI|nr:hypothetical protein Tsubulata_017431 [Turnera subulata]